MRSASSWIRSPASTTPDATETHRHRAERVVTTSGTSRPARCGHRGIPATTPARPLRGFPRCRHCARSGRPVRGRCRSRIGARHRASRRLPRARQPGIAHDHSRFVGSGRDVGSGIRISALGVGFYRTCGSPVGGARRVRRIRHGRMAAFDQSGNQGAETIETVSDGQSLLRAVMDTLEDRRDLVVGKSQIPAEFGHRCDRNQPRELDRQRIRDQGLGRSTRRATPTISAS